MRSLFSMPVSFFSDPGISPVPGVAELASSRPSTTFGVMDG